MDELDPFRREAIRTLSTAVATDRLSVEQFESRLELVRQASNRATLDAIVADVLPSGPYPLSHEITRSMPVPTRYGGVEPAELLRIKTVLGSSKRAGSWTVPLRLELIVVLGEITIDLRDAVFGAEVLDIDLSAKFGSITLIVPAGTQVENECEEKLSSSSHSTRSARGAGPLGLLIRITGRVVLSSLDIKEKRRSGEGEDSGTWKRLLGG
jgi:hypothetical protein